MKIQQILYNDFSDGLNDTSPAISIKDSELAKSENAVFSDEVKGVKTAKGCTKINAVSYGTDVTDGFSWTVGSVYKTYIVRNGKVYDINVETGDETEKIALTAGATRIYPFQLYNQLYFGDGTELYVCGDFDYYSELGVKDIAIGNIVKNNTSSLGVIGNFYRAKTERSSVNLTNEDYSNETNWEDVTDVRYLNSNVVRPVIPFDPSQPEIVSVGITRGASAAGTVSIVLNNETFTASISSSDTVPQIVDKIFAMNTPGWTKVKSGNTVKFTRNTVGLCETGYLDPGTTGIGATYETIQEGKGNDNNLAPIKKCTMFWVHTGSFRVFATGNPEDTGLYYSEIGKPTYFKADINKIYPASGYGRPMALHQLGKSLLVSYENGWYVWNGITPLEDASWDPINLPYGCVSNDSLALAPQSFIFLGDDGIYNVHASILSSEIYLIQGRDVIKKISDARIDKTIASIKDKSMCKGKFFNNTYYLAYNTDGVKNDRVIEYEWNTKSFTIRNGWQVNAWLSDPHNLYFASKNYLLRANDGYSDIDIETGLRKPILFDVVTKAFALGNPFSNKLLRFLALIFKQNEADVSGVDVILHMGYESVLIQDHSNPEAGSIDLAESFVWGRQWGKIWGYNESVIKMIEVGLLSNTFQVEIKGRNLDDPITLIGIGFIFEETDLITPNILKDEVLLK